MGRFPRVRELEGSFFDIGQALGSSQDWGPVLAEDVGEEELAAACESLVRERFPPAGHKFDGIVAALGIDPERLRPWYFARGASAGCVTFGWEQQDPIIGRVYHWVHEAAKWCEARMVRPAGGLRFLAYTHNACGVPDGVNETGLSLFLAALPPHAEPTPGLPWHAIMDCVLTCATDVREAVEIMQELPHNRPFVYFLADAKGDLAAVEVFPDGSMVRGPQDGLLVATNYATARKLPSEHASRQEDATARLAALAPPVGPGAVERIVASHGGPFCVGRHPEEGNSTGLEDTDWYALWGMVVRPKRRSLFLAPGQPCRTQFAELPWPGSAEVPP